MKPPSPLRCFASSKFRPGAAALAALLLFPGCAEPLEENDRPRLGSEEGVLLPYNEKGDRLPDFSAVGYRNGVVDRRAGLDGLPVIEVAPGGENRDAALINTALAKAAEHPRGGDGYRAVVALAPGEYGLEATVEITASGIILTGPEEGEPAVLTYLPREQGTAVQIGSGGGPRFNADRAVPLNAGYVPVGADRLPLAGGHGFEPGDEIIVRHDFNEAWIRKLGMDRIPPRWVTAPDGTRRDATVQWRAEDYVYDYLRVVTAAGEDWIEIDAPMVQALDARFGETWVGPYTHANRIENIGVAHLTILSAFDDSLTEPNTHDVEPGRYHYVDEEHGAWAIGVGAARQGWIHRVTARHFFHGCVNLGRHSSHFTVSHSESLDPVSRVAGGRRYSFYITGQRHLVKHCRARGGRHDFAGNSRVAGPNVFYDCVAEDAFNCSEPHHRMAFGFLFDNVRVRGPGAALAVLNRGNNGTGHGWMGMHTVFWNCAAPMIIVQRPPIGQNFAIGVSEPHDRTTEQFKKNLELRLRLTNARSGMDFTFDGGPFIGDGHFESPDAPVSPGSLYRHQLERRLAGDL